MKHAYGWKPDKPDPRDRRYSSLHTAIPEVKPELPSHFSLRESMPPIINQGDIGSCTACSISTVLMHQRIHRKEKPEFRPSDLFIYYNERKIEGTIGYDAGAEIRNGIKSVANDGFCTEKHWPYVESKFRRKPSLKAYWNARKYKALEYYRMNNKNIDELKRCLVSGFPFVFGFSVFLSIEEADYNGGFIPLPKSGDSMDGGHAVVCCGYDDEKKLFQLHNSWGTEYGDKGYYYLPYDFMTNTDLCDDFWYIKSIDEKDGI